MESLKLAFHRIKALFTRNAIDRDMDKEMLLHVDLLAEEYESKGMSSEEARLAARRRFGNLNRIKESGGDIRGAGMLEGLLRDAKHALRGFIRTPGFAVAVVLMFALGIGANTAIFSIVERLLLRALPYPGGEQLVLIREYRINPESRMSVSPANLMDWQRMTGSFESVAGYFALQMPLTGEGEPEQLDVQAVTHEFFPTLGVSPLIGRAITPEDDQPGANPTVVLSHGLWQRKFGGNREIIGKTIQLNGTGAEVVGVMPAGFRFLTNDTDLWTAFRLDRARDWRGAGRFMNALGRLKPAVTLDGAQTAMSALAKNLAETYPFNRNSTFRLVPVREELTGEVRNSLLILFGAVGVLLTIACMNVTTLMLARSAARRQEYAIRMSLGAGKWGIVRQLIAESVLIAAAGGLAGIAVAKLGIDLLLALAPENILLGTVTALDGWVLLYTFGISTLCGIVVGIAPAATVARRLARHIQDGGRTATSSVPLRQGLVILQIAMTVVLLCGAGLLMRSLAALNNVETGVRKSDVLSMRIALPGGRYTPPRRAEFFRQAGERIQSLSGVRSVAAGVSIPVTGVLKAGTSFHILGEPQLPPGERPTTTVRIVTPGYFKTLGIPVLKGREFLETDQARGARLIFVVNESFVKRFLPDRDPLEASISVNMLRENPYSPIVGIVGDVKEGSLRDDANPTVFYTYMHLPGNFPPSAGMVLFVRADRRESLAQQATQIVRDMEKDAPITEVQWLDEAFDLTLARERLNAVVSAAFGLSALILAILGIYGLLSFVVTERTREIGVRMAIGARPSMVLRMVLKQGLRLAATGGVIGLVAAFGFARLIETLLFGVPPSDPWTFIAVGVLLFTVSALATLVPARQATKVDPVIALRQD